MIHTLISSPLVADRFCAIDSYNSDGQQPLLNNEASNRALPIPVTFDGVDMYFERTTIFEEQVSITHNFKNYFVAGGL